MLKPTKAKAEFMTITPKLATQWLEKHADVVIESGLSSLNRIINDNRVNQLGEAMKASKFRENGETIKIAENGRLLDGQHRLWACVHADVPFRCLVVRGFEEHEINNVFITTDIGTIKIPSAFLNASGVSYGSIVAPAIRYIMSYQIHKSLTKRHMLTTPEVVDFGIDHSTRLVDSASFVAKYMGMAPPGILCSWHYLMFEKNQADAAQFIIDLKDGIGMSKGDPVHTMRERLIINRGKASKVSRLNAPAIFAMGLNMWNDRRKGVRREIIRAQQLDYSKLPKLV